MSETLIKVENLGKKFCRSLKRSLWYGVKDIGSELIASKNEKTKLRKDEFWALKDVNFDIKKGELVGLIGPNGAGKTTLFKLLSGLIKPDTGEICIKGKIQALIALGAGFNPILTGRENIYINGAILGFSKKKLDGMIDEILDFSEVGEFIDMPVQSYSSGMHVRLGFSVAVNLRPDILIVDEVLAVGDASFRRKARNKMMELLHSGISVVFVSHNMPQVNSITSRCIYLKRGRVVSVGPSDEITSLYLRDSIKGPGKSVNTVNPNKFMENAYVCVPNIFILKKVHIIDPESGQEADEFTSLSDIEIVFTVMFRKSIEKVSFNMAIRGQMDDMIVGSSKVTPKKNKFFNEITVKCLVVKNRLREGIYNIGFYASDLKGGALFKSNLVSSFTILADMNVISGAGSSQGIMILDTTWDIDKKKI